MRISRLFASTAFLLASSAVLAQGNVLFLRDAPIDKMNKEDLDLLVKNYTAALDRNADGQASAWTNPKTGASGTAKPLSTKVEKGTTCRELEFTNRAGGLTGGGTFNFCKIDGAWKIP